MASTGEAIGEIVRSPIESARSAGEALLEPGTTMRRVGESMREKSLTSDGQGEVVVEVLSAIFGPKLGHKFLKRIKGTKLARQISDGLESGLEEARKIVGTERTPTSSAPGRARSDRPQEDLSSGSETAETRDAAIGRETEPTTSTQSPTAGNVAPSNRSQRLTDLSKDLDHGGKITPMTTREAEYILEAEDAGILKGAKRPSGSEKGDFVDANGRAIDVKFTDPESPRGLSYVNKKTAVSGMQTFFEKTKKAIASGEFQLLDSRNLTADQLKEIRAWISSNGFTADQIRIWP